MTLSEFRYWLEGFEASFDRSFERPNSEQWAEIKAKLALVDAPKPAALIPTPREYRPDWPKPEPTRKWVDVIKQQGGPFGDGYVDPNKHMTAAESGVYEFYVGPSALKTVKPASPKAEADDRN